MFGHRLREKYKDYLHIIIKLKGAYDALEETKKPFGALFEENSKLLSKYNELQILSLSLQEDPTRHYSELSKINKDLDQLESTAPWIKAKVVNTQKLAEQMNIPEATLIAYQNDLKNIMLLKQQLMQLQMEISKDLNNKKIPASEKREVLQWSQENLSYRIAEVHSLDEILVGEFQQNLMEQNNLISKSCEKLGKEQYKSLFETNSTQNTESKPLK
jgi:hypothetical protein